MAVGGVGRSGGSAIRPQSVATLKTITLRLSSTSSKQLAQCAAAISDSIWSCRDILSTPQDALKANGDVSVLVHRYKTHLSTLLQDRAVEARWAAVVLVKATIEAGGLETLSKSNAWVRNLLAILKKHDPPTTRGLAVLALTRIFMLTWEHTNLVREITTPALPSFISTCLNNAASNRCSGRELQAILDSFSALLPRHPNIFRSNEKLIHALLSKILSSRSSRVDAERHFTTEHRTISSKVWIQLHHCAPKAQSGQAWETLFSTTIRAAHATCDRVFRSVTEQWETVAGIKPTLPPHSLSLGECAADADEMLGLEGWKGVDLGMQRLSSLIDLLSTSIEIPAAVQVSVKIGELLDLISRLLAVRQHDTANFNPQISKEERDAMLASLPAMHTRALILAGKLISRYTVSALSVTQPLLAEIGAFAKSEISDTRVRGATFAAVQQIVDLTGPSMTKEDVQDIEIIIRACCESVLPAERTEIGPVDVAIPTAKTSSYTLEETKETRQAAYSLLPVLVAKLRPSCLSPKTRTRMERTAVLAKHKDAMMACVLNPVSGGPRVQPSLLPILARQYSTCPEVEATIRPRMPVIRSGNKQGDEENEDEEEMGDPDQDIETESVGEVEAGNELNTFIGQTVTPAIEGGTTLDIRNIEHNDPLERPTKRLRASPVAESPVPKSVDILPGRPLETADIPRTVAVNATSSKTGASSTQPVTLPAQSTPVPPTTGESDDESDFEMPPLTMDPDTDPETD